MTDWGWFLLLWQVLNARERLLQNPAAAKAALKRMDAHWVGSSPGSADWTPTIPPRPVSGRLSRASYRAHLRRA